MKEPKPPRPTQANKVWFIQNFRASVYSKADHFLRNKETGRGEPCPLYGQRAERTTRAEKPSLKRIFPPHHNNNKSATT